MSLLHSVTAFLQDYGSRHCHPINAVLHVIGIPMVLYALYCMLTGSLFTGLVLFVVGYFLQYLGHRAQKNEVGEVTLIKRIIALINARLGYDRK
jgi:uncharacterized membrane protein YGL010W